MEVAWCTFASDVVAFCAVRALLVAINECRMLFSSSERVHTNEYVCVCVCVCLFQTHVHSGLDKEDDQKENLQTSLSWRVIAG